MLKDANFCSFIIKEISYFNIASLFKCAFLQAGHILSDRLQTHSDSQSLLHETWWCVKRYLAKGLRRVEGKASVLTHQHLKRHQTNCT